MSDESGVDDHARNMAHEALSRANEAYGAARGAENTADQALEEIRELRDRLERLEAHVEALIRMLEERVQELIAQTDAVRRAVEVQGQQVRDTVETHGEQVRKSVETQGAQIREGIDKTTESVATGFTTMSHQEVKGRLLDSRTALLGLATKLLTARNALRSEFDQAQRRGDELKIRFTEAVERTVDALHRDVGRLGSEILRIQSADFRKTIEDYVPATRSGTAALEIAHEVGETTLEGRNRLMAAHLDPEKVNVAGLDEFKSKREAFLHSVDGFVHRRLGLEEGTYALRVYFAEGRSGRECLLAAVVEPGERQLAFKRIDGGLGRLAPSVANAWNERTPARQLSAEERERVERYVRLMQSQGLLTPEEAGIILQHVNRNTIQIHIPTMEPANGTAA